jgi:hypothetical protein
LIVYSLPGLNEHIGRVFMRTILFAVALLSFTASAHAAAPPPLPASLASLAEACTADPHQDACKPNAGVTEEWRPDGKDGPAVILRDAATGKATVEIWGTDTMWDRSGGPAIIERDPLTGIVTNEAWYKNGKPDRADGPAVILRDARTGKVTREDWYKDGKKIAPTRAADK